MLNDICFVSITFLIYNFLLYLVIVVTRGHCCPVLVQREQICIGMAMRGYQEEGDLFICLEPTSDKAQCWGGRYKYQQVVIGYIIEEFGFDQEAIVPIPLIVN